MQSFRNPVTRLEKEFALSSKSIARFKKVGIERLCNNLPPTSNKKKRVEKYIVFDCNPHELFKMFGRIFFSNAGIWRIKQMHADCVTVLQYLDYQKNPHKVPTGGFRSKFYIAYYYKLLKKI